jgi:hypothetical protein
MRRAFQKQKMKLWYSSKSRHVQGYGEKIGIGEGPVVDLQVGMAHCSA